MENSKILNVLLVISGIISIIVGGGMLFFPVEFHATAGIVLDGNINLNNEMRAAGGPVLVGGLIITLGAFFERIKFTATLLAGFFYLSYGCARIVSIVIDGMPNFALIQIAGFEILLGLISTAALFFFYKRDVHQQ